MACPLLVLVICLAPKVAAVLSCAALQSAKVTISDGIASGGSRSVRHGLSAERTMAGTFGRGGAALIRFMASPTCTPSRNSGGEVFELDSSQFASLPGLTTASTASVAASTITRPPTVFGYMRAYRV